MCKITRILLCLLTFLLCGCSSKEMVKQEEQSPEIIIEYGDEWKNDGFDIQKVDADIDQLMNPSYHEAYKRNLSISYEVGGSLADVAEGYYADSIYRVTTWVEKEQTHCRLSIQNMSEDAVERNISLPEDMSGAIALKVDVLSQQDIRILFQCKEHLKVCHINDTGEVQGVVTLPGTEHISKFYEDQEGYIYLVIENIKLIIYDEKGMLVKEREYHKEDEEINSAFHMPDGSVMFLVKNYEKQITNFIWFEVPGATEKIVGIAESLGVWASTITPMGMLYYVKDAWLVRQNLFTGEAEVIFNFLQSNFHHVRMSGIYCDDSNNLFLYHTDGRETEFVELSDEVQEVVDGVVVSNLVEYPRAYIKAETTEYGATHKDVSVVYETGEQDKEAYRNRIIAELVAGKGPDMLVVSGEDMRMLYEKGLIEPLDGMIPEETKEQIFDGVLESCSIDGQLMGICFESSTRSFVVSEKDIPMEDWKLAEIVAAMGDVVEPESFYTGVYMARQLEYLALQDMEGNSLINWKEGTCSFDSELFRKLLSLIKQNGNSEKADLSKILNGDTLMGDVGISNFVWYSRLVAPLEQEYYFRGIPGDDKYQGYWTNDEFLVVNAKSKNKDVASDYINYLLSMEQQLNVYVGTVRRDVLIENTKKRTWANGEVEYVLRGNGHEFPLELNKDGDSYLEEYLEYLENCGPLPKSHQEIQDIVVEEAEAYFEGIHTLDQTIHYIQNRVQLYLDERG